MEVPLSPEQTLEDLNLAHVGVPDAKRYEELTGVQLSQSIFYEQQLSGGTSKTPTRTSLHIVNEQSPRIPLRVDGTNFTLYPPQAGLIHTMLLIEGEHSWFDAKEGKAKDPRRFSEYQENTGIISERMSFGKSTLIPALILHQPVCQWTQRPTAGNDYHTQAMVPIGCEPRESINVVVVGRTTTPDWEKRLKTTSLRFVVVKSVPSLSNAVEVCKTANSPLCVIIRAGNLTVDGVKDRSLSHFARATKGITFSRIFYDDWDMLELASKKDDGAEIPLARFHWLISATATGFPYSEGDCRLLEDGRLQPCRGQWALTDPPAFSRSSFHAFCSGNSPWKFIVSLFSTRCNANFAQLEFNVPPIEWRNAVSAREALTASEMLPTFKRRTSSFIGGTDSVPYVRETHGFKALVSAESKELQEQVLAELTASGLSVVKLDRRNAHRFHEMPEQVGVARLIHGLSMGYLTHVVVLDDKYSPEQVDQVVGRAQRIGRRHNLQAIIVRTPTYNNGFDDGLKLPVTTKPAELHIQVPVYLEGVEDAMFERGMESTEADEHIVDAHPAYLRGSMCARMGRLVVADVAAGRGRLHRPEWTPEEREEYDAIYDDHE